MKHATWEILTAVFILAIVYLLVRPSSLGPALIETMGSALTNLVTFAVSS